MANNKVELINQALMSAEASLRLAKQLLAEMDPSAARSTTPHSKSSQHVASKTSSPAPVAPAPAKEKPGILGIFDGESMVDENGEKHPIPANYASKSMLVVGDTLKMIEEEGQKRFKQVEHVKRYRTTGILAKKEGKFRVVTPEGSYKVLPVSIEHFSGEVGDEVVAYLPAGNLTAAYAALESVNKKGGSIKTEEPEAKVETKPKEEPASSGARTHKEPKKDSKPKAPARQAEVKEAPKHKEKPVEAAPEPQPEPTPDAPAAELGDDELR